MFDEMRLAATLQSVSRQPGALGAREALAMATRDGAHALGLDEEIGSIEPGKRADLILVERERIHLAPDSDVWTTLVYAARGSDVRLTMVDGDVLVRDFKLVRMDQGKLCHEAREAARDLLYRANIG
jgi:5-methylthioadenosine/S-adenosylhomocysteine deaminase